MTARRIACSGSTPSLILFFDLLQELLVHSRSPKILLRPFHDEMSHVFHILKPSFPVPSSPSLPGKHGTALQSSLTELNLDKLSLPAEERALAKDRIKTVTERAALLKLTSSAMVKASGDFVGQCQADGRKWQRLLANEREIRQRLEDMVEQLAKQHSHLEAMVRREYHVPAAGSAGGDLHHQAAGSPAQQGQQAQAAAGAAAAQAAQVN